MTQPLIIWYITDNKRGHLNQLKGLSNRLADQAKALNINVEERWLSFLDSELNWPALVWRNEVSTPKSAPTMVVAAGHKTHLKTLALARKHRAYSVVLMQPSVPTRLFNAAIIPIHDNPKPSVNTLTTIGVLNKISPADASEHALEPKPGVMLIGGQSKHFIWNDDEIISQVIEVLQQDSCKHWTLSNSRRTPKKFMQKLAAQAPQNLTLIEHQKTDATWLPLQIQSASNIWVTPDSVSMVYEAMTSGVPTGVFNLKNHKTNRINSGILELINNNMVTPFAQWKKQLQLTEPTEQLWEADRAARWLLGRIQQEALP